MNVLSTFELGKSQMKPISTALLRLHTTPRRASAHTFECQLKITFRNAFQYYEQQLSADRVRSWP